MLGYEDVLNADHASLGTAAAKWREMTQKLHTLETDYDRDVLSVTRNGQWTGGTAAMARFQMTGTKGQIKDAQVEANAMASLLDDAKADFEAAAKQLRDTAAGAVKDGYKVTGTGVAVLDTSKLDKATLDDLRHDKGTMDAYNAAAEKWTKAIAAAVKAATDADRRAAVALRKASKAGDPDYSFNGKALGGGDAVDAQRAADLASRLDSLTSDERDLLANLMRANADSPEFSRTLLDRVGPDGMLHLAQQLEAPGGDAGKKAVYPGLQTDLARALASATQDPNTDFYRNWREQTKKLGEKNYGSNTEPVYGYQLLTTLMAKGDAKYSAPFLSNLADDITASEKAHPGRWSYRANHFGDALGADPLDTVLSIMSRHPDTATAYLDPAADGGNDRLHYLLKERQWPQGYLGAAHLPDPLSQSGLAAALEAAATGEPPGTPHDGKHTEAQARVMHGTLVALDEGMGGESINERLRRPVAAALADYASDTHELLGLRNDFYNRRTEHDSVWTDGDTVRMSIGQDQLVRVMRGLSDDPAAYAALHRAETEMIARDLGNLEPNASASAIKDAATKGGSALGAFDAIRTDIALDVRDDKNAEADWKAKALYHLIGAPITPGIKIGEERMFGDVAQRIVDTWIYDLDLQDRSHNESEAKARVSDLKLNGAKETTDLLGYWAQGRGISPEDPLINSLQTDVLNSQVSSSTLTGHYLGRGNV
ncbi:DUF6571 family protein [Kitasatospora sp. NPDC093102]|uniref:DUF6571 family protein n=1 Tax=Kitasatospora sp. NPDC093102 TaxID=3155069 RepID=UPI00341C6863